MVLRGGANDFSENLYNELLLKCVIFVGLSKVLSCFSVHPDSPS